MTAIRVALYARVSATDQTVAPQLDALRRITRVDFGGAYEEALLLVGGSPPLVRHLRPVD